MQRLSETELDLAFNCIEQQGHGSFFPAPPEWTLVAAKWAKLRAILAARDLDVLRPLSPLKTFVPKSRLAIRLATHLHPLDLITYTALALRLKPAIAESRVGARRRRVYSYRTEGTAPGELFQAESGYSAYIKRIKAKLESTNINFVGTADIADFFPRIYQHRLVNALQAASSAQTNNRGIIRALEKQLASLSGDTSYGIPVGPNASRLLAEAELIDVDAMLLRNKIDFVRYVDDFVIFGKKTSDIDFAIRTLAQYLFNKHGLTLQTAKTDLFSVPTYKLQLTERESRRAVERELLQELAFENESGYGVRAIDDLDEQEQELLGAADLKTRLSGALTSTRPDFQEISIILGRMAGLRDRTLIPLVYENLERLYPVAHSLARFFSAFGEDESFNKKDAATQLLRPIVSTRSRPPEYYSMWILWLLGTSAGWNHSADIVKVFERAQPDENATRRYAALALRSTGTRGDVLQIMSDIKHQHPLVHRSAYRIKWDGVSSKRLWDS